MTARLERLVDDAAFYADQLERIGAALLELVLARAPHRQLLDETADAYRLITMDLVEIFALIKRAYRHTYGLGAPSGPAASLETLEKVFVIYRDAAELADARAQKMSRSRSKEAKKAASTAQTLVALAENAAKMLVAEASRLGRWTVEWERELGLRRWLR